MTDFLSSRGTLIACTLVTQYRCPLVPLKYYLNNRYLMPMYREVKSICSTYSSRSWRHLSADEPDTGLRWTVIWDMVRKPGTKGRNTAAEKHEANALERARHFLRMGFIVYEICEPSGSIFLDEGGIRQRLGSPANLKPREKAGPSAMAAIPDASQTTIGGDRVRPQI